MKNVLAQKGIMSVSYMDENKVKYLFAYTQNMLDNRIILELYEEDNTDDPESDEGYTTGLNVYMVHENKCYVFTMLLDARPVIPRIYLYRSILDTIEIIETSNPGSLTANLEEAAMASVNSDVYPEKQWKDDFNKKINERIEEAFAIIGQPNNA